MSSQCRLPDAHARLAPGGWSSSTGQDSHLQRFQRKVSIANFSQYPPFTNFLTHPNCKRSICPATNRGLCLLYRSQHPFTVSAVFSNGTTRWSGTPDWPRGSPCASPQTEIDGDPGDAFTFDIEAFRGHRFLPIIRISRAA